MLLTKFIENPNSKGLLSWNPQYRTLDHWRAIAALWVMVFHGFGTLYQSRLHPIAESLKHIAQPGWLGVHLFFVISGYCISASVYRTCKKGEISPAQFLRSRAERLLPVYWLAFLLSLLINLLASPLNSAGFWTSFPDSWQSWLGNILLIQPYIDVPYYVIVYWSLVVEVGFYLIVSALLLLAQRFNYKIAILAGLSLGFASVLAPVSSSIKAIPLWSEFLCGVLTFIALLSWHHNRNATARNASLLILALFFLSGSLSHFSLQNNQLWFSALFSLVLYFLYPLDTKLSNIKSISCLRDIGLMSYSLYLLHIPFQGKIVNLGSRFFSTDSLWILLVQLVGWSVALIASYLFFRIVEKPLNDWRYSKKYIEKVVK